MVEWSGCLHRTYLLKRLTKRTDERLLKCLKTYSALWQRMLKWSLEQIEFTEHRTFVRDGWYDAVSMKTRFQRAVGDCFLLSLHTSLRKHIHKRIQSDRVNSNAQQRAAVLVLCCTWVRLEAKRELSSIRKIPATSQSSLNVWSEAMYRIGTATKCSLA